MNSLKNSHVIHGDRQLAASSPSPGKIRLLKFVCNFGSGGTEGQVFNLVRELQSTHFAPELACLSKTGPFVEEYAKRGIAMREFPIQSFFSRAACIQMIRFSKYLRSSQIEIVHAYNFYSLVFALPAARLAGVPVIIASIRDRGVYLTRKQKLVQKLVCRMADKILVNAESIRAWLLEQGYQGEKIAVIQNGIDLSPYESESENWCHRDAIRRDRGVQENTSLVVMLARLNRQKGVEDFIQAAALVRREYPDTRFLIIGKPSIDSITAGRNNVSDHQHWVNLRNELMLDNTVFFCGHRSDVPQILSQAAVSVLPSHDEGLSNTLLESMAAGVPVVATRVGGNPELVEDGVNGILVPAHCPEQLAEAISRILRSRSLASRLGRAGRFRARKEFSLSAMVNRTRDIYTSEMGRREVLS